MPSGEAEPVTALQQKIDGARAAFNDLHQRFEAMVADYVSAAPNLADDLIAHAEEFGREETILLLRQNPVRFGLPSGRDGIAAEDVQRLATAMDKLIAVSADLDALTVERENILCARDPSRQRVYNSYGREFVMDWDARKVRYLDRPGDVRDLEVQVVEPRRPPGRAPKPDDTLRPRAQAQPRSPNRSRTRSQ